MGWLPGTTQPVLGSVSTDEHVTNIVRVYQLMLDKAHKNIKKAQATQQK